MRKVYYFATLAISFAGGVGITSFMAPQEHPIGSIHMDLNENDIISEKLVLLEQQLNTLLSRTIDVSRSLETVTQAGLQRTTLEQPPREENKAADRDVAAIPENIATLSEDEANAIKDNIYSSLFYPDTTLQTVMNSAELGSLPPAMQQEVYSEIARKIDSGEVDLERFLPGYRLDEEKAKY